MTRARGRAGPVCAASYVALQQRRPASERIAWLSEAMARCTLHARLTVAEVLRRWPETAMVFVRRRMACVGCPMARFESVADVAAIYGIPTADLVTALRRGCRGARARRAVRQKR